MIEHKYFEQALIMVYKMFTEGRLTSFIDKKELKYIARCISNHYYPIVTDVFKRKYVNCHDIDDLVDLAFNFQFLGVNIKPQQIREEITSLLKMLSKIKPITMLEIGTAGGGTLFLFTRVASPDASVISVDLPQELINYGIDPKSNARLFNAFPKGKQKIILIWADSHNLNTIKEVNEILGILKVDFLFLDGDHSYGGVKRDFEMYSPLVRRGGIVALHDIVEYPDKTRCDVSKFWREVKANYEHTEIVKDWEQRWAGIGVLFL